MTTLDMRKLSFFFRWALLLLLGLVLMLPSRAQTPPLTLNPTATFTYLGAANPEPEEAESYTGSAPVKAEFKANPSDLGGYSARYEWQIFNQEEPETPIVHRFDEDLEYTFESSGSFVIEVSATFVQGTDTIIYPEEGEQGVRFTVTILESKLEMPNGFSPNGDGTNDTYRAKDTHQSIVSFRATIFNRWGQKLYSWNDVNGEWDGRVNGRVVKDGVYYVNVVARGADGHEYRIRKDVNVMTRLVQDSSEGTTTEGEE